MSDDLVLTAVQRFMDAVETRLTTQKEETRSALTDIQTRAATSGPQGERGTPGDRGERGEVGPVGPIGPKGEPGDRGAQGIAGDKGERGADGIAGRDGAASMVPGPQGEKGERGADGLAGRDGPPSVVPGPRGETGERGADGVATLADLDARIEARFADLQVRTFADVYQGVFEPDKLYSRGLFATWGGSLWLSLNETRSKPGENGDWKLVVKRGADGRK